MCTNVHGFTHAQAIHFASSALALASVTATPPSTWAPGRSALALIEGKEALFVALDLHSMVSAKHARNIKRCA